MNHQTFAVASILALQLREEPRERLLPTKHRPKRTRDPVAELKRRKREARRAKASRKT